MSPFVLSQILVGIAVCSDVISFQFKEKAHIIGCLQVSSVMISLHFMCLGHWTAACLALVAAAIHNLPVHQFQDIHDAFRRCGTDGCRADL